MQAAQAHAEEQERAQEIPKLQGERRPTQKRTTRVAA
tara:strand:- start:341 stop:451 length:111 start_codon:yes stop_codon:yes gene_type:complete